MQPDRPQAMQAGQRGAAINAAPADYLMIFSVTSMLLRVALE